MDADADMMEFYQSTCEAAGWTYQTARMTGNPTFYHPEHGHVMAESWEEIYADFITGEDE